MPKVANITVNNQRSEGSIGEGSAKSDKEIIKQLKKMNNNFSKMLGNQKKSSIFGAAAGGAAGGGLLADLISFLSGAAGGIATGGAAIVAGAAGAATGGSAQTETGYRKILDEETGEEQVAEINTRTGKIVKILTLQEARDQEILNSKDEISFFLRKSSIAWDESTEGLKTYKDFVILSDSKMAEILDEEIKQVEIQKAINSALTRKLKKLDGRVPSSGTPGAYSAEYGIGFDSSGQGYSAAAQITNRETVSDPFQPYDAWWKQSDSKFVSSMYKSP